MPTTIADHVFSCLKSFKSVTSISCEEPGGQGDSKKPEWKIGDEMLRFKVWSGNLGAHQQGKSSLDYRLRDASHLSTQVKSLLEDLKDALDNACSILDETKIPWDQESLGEESDDESISGPDDYDIGFATEMDQISFDITEVIDCLMNLSVSIRNPAPQDRFRGSMKTDTSFYEPADIAHVQAKWNKADPSLVELLGKANTRRRQYFKYRESHHQKLSRGLDINFDAGKTTSKRQSTVASSIPDELKASSSLGLSFTVDVDQRSDSGFTQTSYSPSADLSNRPRFPALPSEATKGPFQCPFCFAMITVTTSNAWRKHIFADLRPYSCVAVDCPVAGIEFGRRHHWMQHMLQNHWYEWRCEFCSHEPFTSMFSLRDHLGSQHAEIVPVGQEEAIISLCSHSIPLDIDWRCPLCDDSLGSVEAFCHHVGQHLEDIALFVLPQNTSEDEDLDDKNSISSSRKLILSEGEDKENLFADDASMSPKDSTGGGRHTPVERSLVGEGLDLSLDPMSDPEESAEHDAWEYIMSRKEGSDILVEGFNSLWAKIKAQPDSYVMTLDEYNRFNSALSRFGGTETVSAARGRYHQYHGHSEGREPELQTYAPEPSSPDQENETAKKDLEDPRETGNEASLTMERLSAETGLSVEKVEPRVDQMIYKLKKSGDQIEEPPQDVERAAREPSEVERTIEAGRNKAEDSQAAQLVETIISPPTIDLPSRERTVRFRESVSRPRDSGLSRFSVEDYDTQRFNVGALQEALDSSREEKGRYKSRAHELDAQLAASKAALREKELEHRNLIEEGMTLRNERDTFESEVHDLRRRLGASIKPDHSTGGGSSESSDNLSRSKSKRQESQEQKSRLLERIHTINPNTEPKRDSTRRRRSSVSQPRTASTRELVVNDRTPRGPSITTRGFDRFENNYTSTSPIIRAEAGSVLSQESGTSSMNTFNTAISGGYVPEPLPPKPKVEEKSSSGRKHRHH